jgi:GT2 family glycosyltransferase
MKEVSLILLCVDMPEMTRRCVELIRTHTPAVYQLTIVCDKPSEEMKGWLEKMEKDGAKVITNPEPVGTPTALNMGIRAAQGKYIALVNNDITVTKGWFDPLMEALKRNPSYGWVASKIIRGDTVMNWGVISCTLFLKEAMDRVGPFDERFSQGIGWEDNDYLLRFWLAGYSPHGVHKSTVYHPPYPVTLRAVHGNTMPEKYELNRRLFIEKWGPEVMSIDWVNIPYEGE